jgi:DnaA family protein
MKQIALDIGLACAPSFSNFFAGPNEPALSHLQLWAGSALRSPVPTYLWGPSGSGKTHLLTAAQQALREQGARVGWMGAAVTEPEAFDESWAAVVLDDCHLYSAVQQHAAFNWFVQAVHAPDGRPRGVLAAGLWPPADLPLRDDLRSRLGWGHVFALQALDDAQLRAVLRRQADARGILLGDEVMDFILSRFTRDLVHLTQLLEQLDGYSLRTQRPITVPMLKAMLEES